MTVFYNQTKNPYLLIRLNLQLLGDAADYILNGNVIMQCVLYAPHKNNLFRMESVIKSDYKTYNYFNENNTREMLFNTTNPLVYS